MEFLKSYLDFFIFSVLFVMWFISIWFAVDKMLLIKNLEIKKYHSKAALKIALFYRINHLGTIAHNAPYVGLLGTVLGIMITFYDIGSFNKIETKQIMVGLALALKATAGGIFVALIASFLNNYLINKIEILLLKYNAEKIVVTK